MASSCSPSSSAVTIPIPGKPILKKPAQTSQSLFSRFTRFLPTQNPVQPIPIEESKPLKRAHFILPQIATVYPISSLNPPSTPTLRDEKKAIEDREAERRRRVIRGNSLGPDETEEWWSLEKVESFYRECCEGTDEQPDPAITATFKVCSVLLNSPFIVFITHTANVGHKSAYCRSVRSTADRRFGGYPLRRLYHRVGSPEVGTT